MSGFRVKRVYAAAAPDDGLRVLVDRVWPRGLSKDRAAIDRWLKDVAPSTGLRRWFGHDPAKWEEFCRRYTAELDELSAEVDALRQPAREQTVTLLFAATDEEHNNAVALKHYLESGT